jgi:hypothetical protein
MAVCKHPHIRPGALKTLLYIGVFFLFSVRCDLDGIPSEEVKKTSCILSSELFEGVRR